MLARTVVRVADLAGVAGHWLAWRFGSASVLSGRTELVARDALPRGPAVVGVTGRLVFTGPDGGAVDARVSVLSPGVALVRFAGEACEAGACPAGTVVRCAGAAVPFNVLLGGYIVDLDAACQVFDAVHARPVAMYPPGVAW